MLPEPWGGGRGGHYPMNGWAGWLEEMWLRAYDQKEKKEASKYEKRIPSITLFLLMIRYQCLLLVESRRKPPAKGAWKSTLQTLNPSATQHYSAC